VPDSRELATAILALLFLSWALSRKKVRQSVPALLRATFDGRLLPLWVAYIAYAVALLVVAERLGAWAPSLIWDTMLVVFFVGLPMTTRAFSDSDGRQLVRRVLREAVGISALVALYVSLAPFSLPVELVLQTLATLAAVLRVVSTDPSQAAIRRLLDVLLIGIGSVYLINTTAVLADGMAASEWKELGLTAALAIWYPLALIPFAYAVGYLGSIGTASARVRARRIRRERRRYAPMMFLACRLSLLAAHDFTGPWCDRLAATEDRESARFVLRQYRQRETPGSS
jgi:hypothetical protein